MSRAGGVDFPGEVGRDRRADRGRHPRLGPGAAATGQDYDVDPATLDAVLPHVTAIAAEGPVEGLFGPAVPVADDAPTLDRIIGADRTRPGLEVCLTGHTGVHGPGDRPTPDCVLQGPGARRPAPRDGLPQRRRHRRGALTEAERERHGAANSWQSLPGIGPKTAKVIAQAWVGREPDVLVELRSAAKDLGGGDIRAALRGDLHVHSNWSDGSAPIEEMMLAAKELGHEYCALTDHSPRLKVANGLSRLSGCASNSTSSTNCATPSRRCGS